MRKKEEQIACDDIDKDMVRNIIDEYMRSLYPSEFDQEGVHYYGKSNHFNEAFFNELLSLVHPSHLNQNLHLVFFNHRRTFMKKLFSRDYFCRQDLVSLVQKIPFSCFRSETDTYLYFYEFNIEKEWEETIILTTILTYLYEGHHPEMSEEKRKRKRQRYLFRMLFRLRQHFEEKRTKKAN